MQSEQFDLAVIGAGFHGISIAREARRCGLNVVLIHDNTIIDCPAVPFHAVLGADIGKLESLNFTEVMANQRELNQWLSDLPQLTKCIPVFIAHNPNVRSFRRVKFGIRAYRSLQNKVNRFGSATIGVSAMSDQLIGIQQDAVFPDPVNEFSLFPKRLLIRLAQDAVKCGVVDLSHHIVLQSERSQACWQLKTKCKKSLQEKNLETKAVINCASSSIDNVLQEILHVKSRCQSKTIHSAWVYINKPQQWHYGVMLQLSNKTLPYVFSVNRKTLCAGPIIVESDNPLDKQLAISQLINELNRVAEFQTTIDDIVHCEWHTESIFDNLSSNITDAYNETYLDLNNRQGLAPVLSIFGTNIAQSRKVAQESLNILQEYFPLIQERRHRHTTQAGNSRNLISEDDNQYEEKQTRKIEQQYSALDAGMLQRLYQYYGNDVHALLTGLDSTSLRTNGFDPTSEDATKLLGEYFGHGLYAREVDYLIETEWVQSISDILWRNTDMGLLFDAHQRQQLDQYLKRRHM